MSTRSVIVRLEAEVAGYIAGMGRAAAATDNVARQVVNSRRSISDNAQAMDTAGKTMLAFGTVSVAALGASAKAAMDWESAWAGVTKTVSGTPEQMDELESSLRGLAKTLPATHTEIAGVAEAAGQLGVAREDVVGFTKTMIDLGVSTNLTAEEAATSIAQISNVMGTMAREGSKGVERFGATLVALGNDGASTEAEILAMAQRIAGAAATVGASEVDVLALSNTLASMGIKAELGGGVTTRVLLKMFSAVKEGGPKLDAFARAAGVSAEEFAKAYGDSPIRALDMVDKGLNKANKSGGNVVAMMKEMGIKGTEETQVMLSLAASGDLLSDSLELGTKSWQENTALVAEATKRYETTESKVKIAWNNIKDAAIDAGAVMLPVIQGVAETVSGLAQTFGSLPAPVQGIVTTLAGVVGVAALVGGGMLTLIPKVANARQAFRDLNQAGSRIPDTFSKIAKVGGAVAGLGAVVSIFAKLAEADYMSKIDTGMGRVNAALIQVSQSSPGAARELDSLFQNRDGQQLVSSVNDLDSALKRTFRKDGGQAFDDWAQGIVTGVTGVKGSTAILSDSFKRMDDGLAQLVASGDSKGAAKVFERIQKAAKDQGIEIDELLTKFPGYADALKQAEADGNKAGAGADKAKAGIKGAGDAAAGATPLTKEVAKALEEVGLAADGSVVDIKKFGDSLFAAGLLSLSASDASIAYQAAIDAVTESVIKNGTTLDINTEQGRANQSAFNGQAKAAITAAEAIAEQTLKTEGSAAAEKVLQENLGQSYTDLIKAAGQFGITGDAADDMARKALGIPKNVNIDTWIADHASQTLDAIKGKSDALNGREITVKIFEETWAKRFEQGTMDVNHVSNGPGGRGGTTEWDGGVVVGFAGGGKVPGRPPANQFIDNIRAQNEHATPYSIRSGEWIINEPQSKKNDRWLRAINDGMNLDDMFTFPKGFVGGGQVAASTSVMSYGRAVLNSGGGTSSFEGNLFLDSGEFLGKVRGVAGQVVNGALSDAARGSTYQRGGV